ncbi:MAG: hypothetical protein KC635_17070 [Myxococcales bacterium]|nr:hypothetical protein [Myxococcales bacterium]MCB9735894.1 hypothetical protein [Deltaproteobacteria bacterium]
MTTTTLPCSQASLDVGEPIYATAAEKTDVWLLLEHDGQWAPKVLESPGLAPRTRAWLEEFLADNPTARVQLIRRGPSPNRDDKQRFFFATTGEDNAAMWSFGYTDPAELEKIDLYALLESPRALPESRRFRPLFLVCTHGKRDACCARLGPAIYQALQPEWEDEVWQTSHIGGHRFAATMLCFPHGHCFGRLDAAVARRVASGYAARRLTDLLHYRGRSTYARPVQAAEYFLRQATGSYAIDALHYSRGELLDPDRWRICFFDKASGETHELTIARVVGPDRAPASCGEAPKPVDRLVLESHRQLTS